MQPSRGSSCSESSPTGLTGEKKMVCLSSLLSVPTAMSPVSRMELRLKEQPLWNTNSFQLYGIAT